MLLHNFASCGLLGHFVNFSETDAVAEPGRLGELLVNRRRDLGLPLRLP